MGNAASTAPPLGAEPNVVVVEGIDGEQGYIQVPSPTATVADLRILVEEEFDDDMLPQGPYAFLVNGRRIMAKQESKVPVLRILGNKISMATIAAKKKRSMPDASDSILASTSKKLRFDAAVAPTSGITPTSVPPVPSSTGEMEAPGETVSNLTSASSMRTGTPTIQSNVATVPATEVTPENLNVSTSSTCATTSPDETEGEPPKNDAVIVDERATEAVGKNHSSSSDEDEPNFQDSALDPASERDEIMVEPTSPSKHVSTVEPEIAEDPHRTQMLAKGKCKELLDNLKKNLESNPDFCSQERRQDYLSEIQQILGRAAPKTIVGVLGNTGVGKSSLLNALLDEAAVLPTSGSRGCTATVVELRYNEKLKECANESSPRTFAYQGEVEFITLQEWRDELKILVDECSTQEKSIYARPPMESAPEAAAAWAKINSVYGRNTMEQYHGLRTERVFQILSGNSRVHRLLTPTHAGKTYNSVLVEEGQIDNSEAKVLLKGTNVPGRLRRKKKTWAKAFRTQINDYVYRKGNGEQPQTWPLIRKVVLHGPWPVLSTGACLVDLPGVRDANAARARVSENYLQNCSFIWIVAPIKRAVDDGTAKELLGEQFKRRLLMDGAYGNVSFICTQTDDCEASETMRDHQDVAESMGVWDEVSELSSKLSTLEKELGDLRQSEEDLEMDLQEAQEALKAGEEDLSEAMKDANDNSESESLEDRLEDEGMSWLQETVVERGKERSEAWSALRDWRSLNQTRLNRLDQEQAELQQTLKSMCALVRNEYSKTRLQEDFRSGLKELTQGSEEDGLHAVDAPPIPNDFKMDVYCISANDYLKIQGIKSSRDGRPNTFDKAEDTQIPALQQFVHETTAKQGIQESQTLANMTSDLLDRVKLVATNPKEAGGSASSQKCRQRFEQEMRSLAEKIVEIQNEFLGKARVKVSSNLAPALSAGAAKAKLAALDIVSSWGSKRRRRKGEPRTKDSNGLYWSTYYATCRRNGVYNSASAGEIDFNQELCDPMEKEFSSDWQRIMDASIGIYLNDAERQVLQVCSELDHSMASSFIGAGLPAEQVSPMISTASRTCKTSVASSFRQMKDVARNSQRDLNRSLLPKIQGRMHAAYNNTISVPGGCGKFNRMKEAMYSNSNNATSSMFKESTGEMLVAIGKMVQSLGNLIQGLVGSIRAALNGVYSVCWDSNGPDAVLSPEELGCIQECRNKLLPELERLSNLRTEVLGLLGIEREHVELDVTAVTTWEDNFQKKVKDATVSGNLIDLCDSDSDDEAFLNSLTPTFRRSNPSSLRVKPEPTGEDSPTIVLGRHLHLPGSL